MTKTAYLTIDDSPSENFKEVIDYLVEKEIPAIFFCCGDLLERHEELAIYAISKGFLLGNHSYNHPDFSKIDMNEINFQIRKTDELLDQIYRKANAIRPLKVFRFPGLNNGFNNFPDYGWDKPKVIEIQNILKELGYRQPEFPGVNYKWYSDAGLKECLSVDCTYDSFDWCMNQGEELYGYRDLPTILSRMDEVVPEEGRGINTTGSNEIIMMHSFIPFHAFKAIIEKLLKKGIKFKDVKY